MKRLLFLHLLVGILLLSCEKKKEETFCNDFPLEKPTLTDDVDYKIINAVLEHYYLNSSFIHIDQEINLNLMTIGINGIKERLAANSIEYDSLSLLDYLGKNKTIYFLSDSLLINTVQLINHEEFNCFFSFKNSGWEKYHQKYPNSFGLLSFSRPGINVQGNKAIVEYSWGFGYVGGMGYLLILEKIDGNWIVTHWVNTWIA